MGRIVHTNPDLQPKDIIAFNRAVGNSNVLVNAFSERLGTNRNMIYYIDHLDNFKTYVNQEVEKSDLKPINKDYLKSFNNSLYLFVYSTLNFLFYIQGDSIDQINYPMAKQELTNLSYSIDTFRLMESHVKSNVINKAYSEALFINQFCTVHFDGALRLLEFFTIDLRESPLKKPLKKTKNIISKSLDFDEIKLLMKLDDNVKQKPIQSNEDFSDLLINIAQNRKTKFITDLKKHIKGEAGVCIAMTVGVLISSQVLKVPNKSFKKLYDILDVEFNWDIGSYNSIQPHYKEFMSNGIKDNYKNAEKLTQTKALLEQLIKKYKAV